MQAPGLRLYDDILEGKFDCDHTAPPGPPGPLLDLNLPPSPTTWDPHRLSEDISFSRDGWQPDEHRGQGSRSGLHQPRPQGSHAGGRGPSEQQQQQLRLAAPHRPPSPSAAAGKPQPPPPPEQQQQQQHIHVYSPGTLVAAARRPIGPTDEEPTASAPSNATLTLQTPAPLLHSNPHPQPQPKFQPQPQHQPWPQSHTREQPQTQVQAQPQPWPQSQTQAQTPMVEVELPRKQLSPFQKQHLLSLRQRFQLRAQDRGCQSQPTPSSHHQQQGGGSGGGGGGGGSRSGSSRPSPDCTPRAQPVAPEMPSQQRPQVSSSSSTPFSHPYLSAGDGSRVDHPKPGPTHTRTQTPTLPQQPSSAATTAADAGTAASQDNSRAQAAAAVPLPVGGLRPGAHNSVLDSVAIGIAATSDKEGDDSLQSTAAVRLLWVQDCQSLIRLQQRQRWMFCLGREKELLHQKDMELQARHLDELQQHLDGQSQGQPGLPCSTATRPEAAGGVMDQQLQSRQVAAAPHAALIQRQAEPQEHPAQRHAQPPPASGTAGPPPGGRTQEGRAEGPQGLLARWNGRQTEIMEILCAAASDIPSSVRDGLLKKLQDNDQEVRELCSSAGDHSRHIAALSAEAQRLKQIASGATQQLRACDRLTRGLEADLHRVRQEKEAMEQQGQAWESHIHQMSDYMSRVADQAGGAAAATEAMEDERQALLHRLGEMERAVHVATSTRHQIEQMANAEIAGQREAMQAMETALETHRRERLNAEEELGALMGDNSNLRLQLAMVSGHAAKLHYAMGAVHLRKRFQLLAFRVLSAWAVVAHREAQLAISLQRAAAKLWAGRLRQAIRMWSQISRAFARRRERGQAILLGRVLQGTVGNCGSHMARAMAAMAVKNCQQTAQPEVVRQACLAAVVDRWRVLMSQSHRKAHGEAISARALERSQRRRLVVLLKEWLARTRVRREEKQTVLEVRLAHYRRLIGHMLQAWQEQAVACSSAFPWPAAMASNDGYGGRQWWLHRLLVSWLRQAVVTLLEDTEALGALAERWDLRATGGALRAWQGLVRGHLADQTAVSRLLALRWESRLRKCLGWWRNITAARADDHVNAMAVFVYRTLSGCLHSWRQLSVGAARIRAFEHVVARRASEQRILTLWIAVQSVLLCLLAWGEVAVRRRQGRSWMRHLAVRARHDTLSHAMSLWLGWSIRRRQLAAAELRFFERAARRRVGACLRGWAGWLATRRVQRGLLLRMAIRCDTQLCQAALREWFGQVFTHRAQSAALRDMIAGRLLRLLSVAFAGWWAQGRHSKSDAVRAEQKGHQATCLSVSFRAWASVVEGSAEEEARSLAVVLSSWRQLAIASARARTEQRGYALLCLEKALQRAVCRSRAPPLPDLLRSWARLVQRNAQLRRTAAVLSRSRRLGLCRRCVGSWREASSGSRVLRVLALQAAGKRAARAVREAVAAWRWHLDCVRATETLVHRSMARRMKRQLCSAMRLWHLEAMRNSSRGRLLHRAVTRLGEQRTATAWVAWTASVRHTKSLALMDELAVHLRRNFQVREARRLLDAWQWLAAYGRHLAASGQALVKLRRLRTLARCLGALREFRLALASLRDGQATRRAREALGGWSSAASAQRRERLLQQCSGVLAEHSRGRALATALMGWVEVWRISRVWGLRDGRAALRGGQWAHSQSHDMIVHRVPTITAGPAGAPSSNVLPPQMGELLQLLEAQRLGMLANANVAGELNVAATTEPVPAGVLAETNGRPPRTRRGKAGGARAAHVKTSNTRKRTSSITGGKRKAPVAAVRR